MLEKRGSVIDRRTGKDRRRAYNLDYLLNGGVREKDWERAKGES